MPGVGPRESFGYPDEGWARFVDLLKSTINLSYGGVQIDFLRAFSKPPLNQEPPIKATSLSSVLKGKSLLLPVNVAALAPMVDIPFSAPEGKPCQRFSAEELVSVAYGRLKPRVAETDPKPRLAIAIDGKLAERGQTLEDLADGAGVDYYRILRVYCLGGWNSLSGETPEGRQAADEYHRIGTWLDGSPRGAKWL